MLQIAQLPGIGEQHRSPEVQLHHIYPTSASATEEPAETEEIETVADMPFTPESPVIVNYIWENAKHKKKLSALLGCVDLLWDGSVVTIVGLAPDREEYVSKLEGFLEKYAVQTLLIRDQRLVL